MGITNEAIALSLVLLGIVALLGLFLKMQRGFGVYNTSSLILILVITIASVLAVIGSIDSNGITNILFGVAGFAGGLLTKKD